MSSRWNSHKYRNTRYQVLADGNDNGLLQLVSHVGRAFREKQAEFTASLRERTANHRSFYENDEPIVGGAKRREDNYSNNDVIIMNDEEEHVCTVKMNDSEGEEAGCVPSGELPLPSNATGPQASPVMEVVPAMAPSLERRDDRIRASGTSRNGDALLRRRTMQEKFATVATTDEFLTTAAMTALVLCLLAGGHAWGMHHKRNRSGSGVHDKEPPEATPERTSSNKEPARSNGDRRNSSSARTTTSSWVVRLMGHLHTLVTQISTLAIAPSFPTSSLANGGADPQSTQELQTRVKELKLCLQKEIKAKQDLQDQTVLLKSALDEQRNTVQLLTTEVQSRYSQLAKFEDEHRQVQTELASQVELLQTQLELQQQQREGNQSATEEQCAALTMQIEKLTSELQKREEQWKKFEETVQAKEMEAAAQIEVLQCKLQAQADKQREAQLIGGSDDPRMAIKVKELTEELEARKSHVARLEHQLEHTQALSDSRMNTLKQQVQELSEERNALKQVAEALQEKMQEEQPMDPAALARHEELKAELEVLQQELSAQQEKQKHLESSDVDVRQLLAASEAKCASLMEQLEQLTQELEDRNKQIASLEQTVEEQMKQLQVRQEQLDKMNETTLEMVQLWEEKEQQVEAANAQLESLNKELQQRDAQVKLLERSLEDSAKHNCPEEEKKEEQYHPLSTDLDALRKAREQKQNAFTSQLGALKGKTGTIVNQASELEKEIRAKNELTAKVAALESQLFLKQEEVSSAKSQTVEMKDLLTEKEEQCVELIAKLEATKSELQKLQGSSLKLQLQKERDIKAESERQEQEEMARKLEEMIALLEQKSNDCANNTVRLETLKSELEVREANVKELEKKARSKKKLRSQIESLVNELKTQKDQNDAMRKQFAMKAGQIKILVQQRDNTIAELESKLKALEDQSSPETQIPENSAARIQELETELELQKDQQVKLNSTLQKMIQLVEEKEQECERLTARVDSLTNELSSSKSMSD